MSINLLTILEREIRNKEKQEMIFSKIKNYFNKRSSSRVMLSTIIKELERLDHTKWFNPKIKHSQCHGYGYFKPGTNEVLDGEALVPDIFHLCHPDLEYTWYDGPFFAYPENIDISILTNKDRKKLMEKFRKLTYKDRSNV